MVTKLQVLLLFVAFFAVLGVCYYISAGAVEAVHF